MIEIRPTGLPDARAAGELPARTGTSDVIDALVALAAMPGDQLLTSEPDDLTLLTGQRGLPVTVVTV